MPTILLALTLLLGVSDTPHCILTVEPTRADSLEQGLVDPRTFTFREFEQQRIKAQILWLKHKQFLDELNGRTSYPTDWT